MTRASSTTVAAPTPPGPSVMAALSFFDLPRELRDVIYEHYVTIDGGYVFSAESGKLRAATPHAHPFALQNTFRRAASEMRGLALSCNTVTFSTIGNMRESAFRFDFMLEILFRCMEDDFNRALKVYRPARQPPPFPESVRASIARHFPQFVPAMEAVDSVDLGISVFAWRIMVYTDVEPSLQRDFLNFVTHRLTQESHSSIRHPGIHCLGLRDGQCRMDEWGIPSKEELDYMAKVLRPTQAVVESLSGTPIIEFDGIWEGNRFIYRFSAAAAAIQFLGRHPTSRIHLRRIILNEDREAVAFPESHGKGLIPFCVENPRLHIERRVALWTNLFPVVTRTSKTGAWKERYLPMRQTGPEDTQEVEELYAGGWSLDAVHPGGLSECMSRWILEASVLPTNITLVFDGNPAPEQASKIIEDVVVQDAIWQNALEECFARGLLPDLAPVHVHSKEWWVWMARNDAERQGFLCRGFPRMIRELASGLGPVRCNFRLKAFHSQVEELIWSHRNLAPDDWEHAMDIRWDGAVLYPTAPPLPEFSVIVKDDLVPRSDAEDTASS